MKKHILGFCFDTTGANTGRHNGLIVRLEKYVGEPCWWLACPHHQFEIHVKKVARQLYGDSTAPEEALYKQFRTKYQDLKDEGIELANLRMFDWSKYDGIQTVKQLGQCVLEYILHCLETSI